MAGVSSYAPKEIEFVLKSIVQKHKPAYIIEEFVRRFNKTLNQNQIRYIKNKYGKDPSFGSPMVNYKGGNARDLKNFRRQKLQKRRQTEADVDESTSEHEGIDTQAYGPGASLNMEALQPFYPSPRPMLSPRGTSFLGAGPNTFDYFQPHLLLTQAVVPNAEPQHLGSVESLVPFVPFQGEEQSAMGQDLGGLEVGASNEVLAASYSNNYNNLLQATDGIDNAHPSSDQPYQFFGEPTIDPEAIEMARILALSTPLDMHDSLQGVGTTLNKLAASNSPTTKPNKQSPTTTPRRSNATPRSQQSTMTGSPSRRGSQQQEQISGSADGGIMAGNLRASPARNPNVRRRTSSGAVSGRRSSRAERVRSTAHASPPRIEKVRRNTDPWHRLPPGVKAVRMTHSPTRSRRSAPFPQLPKLSMAQDDLALYRDVGLGIRRETAPMLMNRRAAKLEIRLKAKSDKKANSDPVLYNMGPPGAIEIVESPVAAVLSRPAQTPTIDPSMIQPPTANMSAAEQNASFTGYSNVSPSKPTSLLTASSNDNQSADQSEDVEEIGLQAFLRECCQDGTNSADLGFDATELENHNDNTGIYDGGTTDVQDPSHEQLVPVYLSPQSDFGLDNAPWGTPDHLHENTATTHPLYHDGHHGQVFADQQLFFPQDNTNYADFSFLQSLPDHIPDSFENQFTLSDQVVQTTNNNSGTDQYGESSTGWPNELSEPLDPKMFEGFNADSGFPRLD